MCLNYSVCPAFSLLHCIISSGLYTYAGCSEGGREGMSQAQKAPELYDGIIVGAPAMRYGQQQVNHLASPIQIQTIGYYPGSCVFETFVNATINAYDALDGKTDGVVTRSDLCALNFNVSSMLSKSYSCTAGSTTSLGLGYRKMKRGSSTSGTPAQNGAFNEKDIEVLEDIMTGLVGTLTLVRKPVESLANLQNRKTRRAGWCTSPSSLQQDSTTPLSTIATLTLGLSRPLTPTASG